jgi:hypothetical protein
MVATPARTAAWTESTTGERAMAEERMIEIRT